MKREPLFGSRPAGSVGWFVACAHRAVAAEFCSRAGAADGKSIGFFACAALGPVAAPCLARGYPAPTSSLPLAPFSLPARCNLIQLSTVCSTTPRLRAAAIVWPGSASKPPLASAKAFRVPASPSSSSRPSRHQINSLWDAFCGQGQNARASHCSNRVCPLTRFNKICC